MIKYRTRRRGVFDLVQRMEDAMYLTGNDRIALAKLREYLNGLFYYSPFVPGDRIVLKNVPTVGVESTWWPYRKTLSLGARGSIVDVDYTLSIGFIAEVVFDHTIGTDSRNVDILLDPGNTILFRLTASALKLEI